MQKTKNLRYDIIKDFIPVEGVLTFAPYETKKDIHIAIVDNEVYEDDEQFVRGFFTFFVFFL
jgi:hypothetical protein